MIIATGPHRGDNLDDQPANA